MILPQTYVGTLIVMILSVLCLGLWANTYKLAGKLRFELFYFDFAIGLGLAAVIYGLTVGNVGYDGFSLMDDLMHAGKRQWLFGFGAGVIFNLANMLLLAAVSVAGIAVAFPIALGLALIVGILINQTGLKAANPLYLSIGCVLVLAAIIADAVAYKSLVARRRAVAAAAPATGKKKKLRGPTVVKGLLLSVISGLLMAMFSPLLDSATVEEIGVGPYSLMIVFGAGAFISTFVFNLFFMNLPVEGEPLEVSDYLKMRPTRHLSGLFGGIVCATGILAVFAAKATIPEAHLGRTAMFALSNGGALIAALCGLLFWKEFQQSGSAKATAFVMLILLGSGLAFVSLAFPR